MFSVSTFRLHSYPTTFTISQFNLFRSFVSWTCSIRSIQDLRSFVFSIYILIPILRNSCFTVSKLSGWRTQPLLVATSSCIWCSFNGLVRATPRLAQDQTRAWMLESKLAQTSWPVYGGDSTVFHYNLWATENIRFCTIVTEQVVRIVTFRLFDPIIEWYKN